MIVIGAGLGWLVREAHIQRDAVLAIQRAGGAVEYDWESGPGRRTKKPEPGWLADLIGVDYFGHVTRVRFFSFYTDPSNVPASRSRSSMLWISIEGPFSRSCCASEGIEQRLFPRPPQHAGHERRAGASPRQMTNLVQLNLEDTPISDAGLAHLEGLTNVTDLSLSSTHVTERGLACASSGL